MVAPRFCWVPPRARSLGAECVAWWEAAGGRLLEWQRVAIDGMLGLDEDDRWASGSDALSVARQNGKGVVLQAIEGFFAFELGYPVVLHTAHEFATSLEHQLRLEYFIQDTPHLHARVREKGGYRHANGQESINLKSGCRIVFKARTKGGGRGYSGDLLVWDEAMVLPTTVVGAQMPTLRASQAQHGPKRIYAGSAVDELVHEHGVAFALVRERGLRNDPGVSLHEWSAPFDSPRDLSPEQLRDRDNWYYGNPSLGELIDPEHMQSEIDELPHRTSAVELLNVGAWPRTDDAAEQVISPKQWAALLDDASRLVGQPWLAVDTSPNRGYTSIAAAGLREDGLGHVEIVEYRTKTGWVVPRLVELNEQHHPVAVLVDERGPAAAFADELQAAGVPVALVDTTEYTRSCGVFFDAVAEQKFRHLTSEILESAVRGGRTRPLGDAWAWSRKNSDTDISPLVAATLALAAALAPESQAWVGW